MKEIEMFAFPMGPRHYYSPDHTQPGEDFASVAAHAEEMKILGSVVRRSVIELESPAAHLDCSDAEESFDAHIGAIDLIQRGATGVLSAIHRALADRVGGGQLPNSGSIKPDVIYTNDVIYVRKSR